MIRTIRTATPSLSRLLFACLVLPLFALLAPHTASGAIHATWTYDSSVADLAGFRLYLAGAQVCETNNSAARAIDCNVSLTAGQNSFSMTAFNSTGTESVHSAVATVEYIPPPINNIPVAKNDTAVTNENTAVTIAVLANDTDADGDTLTVKSVGQPSNGTAVISGTGVRYTPTQGFKGTATFTYVATDSKANSNTATVTVTVNAVNKVPVANNDTAVTNENTAVTIAVLANDTDADGDTLTVKSVGQPSNGTAVISGTGVRYTPTQGFKGTTTFTYVATDSKADSNAATVTVTVNAVNTAPIASNDSKTTTQTTPVNGMMSATDADSDALSYLVANYGSNFAEFSWQPNGSYSFTPDAAGTFSFTFTANDGKATSNTATVTITVTPVNRAPVAVNDNGVTEENSPVTIAVLANDTDPDGDTLSISTVGQPSSGSATVSGSSIRYTPAQGFSGNDSFSYSISDGNGGTASATVTILVNKINQTPIAKDGSFINVRGETSTGLVSASDPDNDTLTYAVITTPLMGSVQMDSFTGEYIYTANLDAAGTDTFSFKANDGAKDSNVATITVTVVRPEDILTREFGSASTADYPGTLQDTFTNLDNIINASAGNLATWSWSSAAPHKPANTVAMKATLDVIPSSAIITGAKLYLYQTGSTGAASYNNSVHMITGASPVIAEVTGYIAAQNTPWTPVVPGTTDGNVPLGLGDIDEAADIVTLNTATGYKEWDVTTMVQAWVSNPSANKGLLLKAAEAMARETGRQFASAEYANAQMRPKLVISYAPNTVNGNYPPTPYITATLVDVNSMHYRLDATTSTDLDGRVIDYAWDFGDGSVAFGSYAEHKYTTAGPYKVTLTVMDDEGASTSTFLNITVTDPASIKTNNSKASKSTDGTVFTRGKKW